MHWSTKEGSVRNVWSFRESWLYYSTEAWENEDLFDSMAEFLWGGSHLSGPVFSLHYGDFLQNISCSTQGLTCHSHLTRPIFSPFCRSSPLSVWWEIRALSELKSIIKEDNNKYTVLLSAAFLGTCGIPKESKLLILKAQGLCKSKQNESLDKYQKGGWVLLATGLLTAVQTETTNRRQEKRKGIALSVSLIHPEAVPLFVTTVVQRWVAQGQGFLKLCSREQGCWQIKQLQSLPTL